MKIQKEGNSCIYRSNLSQEHKKIFRSRHSEKSICKGILWAFLYLISIYVIIAFFLYIYTITGSVILIITTMLASVLISARQMRGLENIVHFGSHNNFTSNKKLNDIITNLLAAWPMLQDVRRYRQFHSLHHGAYGSHKDPCRARLEKIGASTQNIKTNGQLLLLVLRWMPKYVQEFYREVKSSNRQLLVFILWHGSTTALFGLVISWQIAIFTLVFWAIVMFMVLPFLRSIAELSEHDYELGENVQDTTFNNLGLLDHLLIHPAGDAWHALHHLHPTIPWWKQDAAHRFLMNHDCAYQNALHRDKPLQDLVSFPVLKM